jgi:hypothetical protein
MSISAPISGLCARRFKLVRHTDVSGVSGTGIVAEGIEWSDGSVALHWCGRWPATVNFETGGIDAVVAIHGHAGATEICWDDGPGGKPFPARRKLQRVPDASA